MKELNALESRRGRRPLDVNNVIYWFKNTRAAVKRAEMKARVGCPITEASKTLSTTTSTNPMWPWLCNPLQGKKMIDLSLLS